MKTLIRLFRKVNLFKKLFIKKDFINKAINFEFTQDYSSNVVLFFYSDNSENLRILIDCINLYNYNNSELRTYRKILTEKLEIHREWKKGKRLSQAGLGNWANKENTLNDMIDVLDFKRVLNNLEDN